jgi:hypothetical protein
MFAKERGRIWYSHQATDDNIIEVLRISCCIIKARDTYSEYVIIIVPHGNKKHANAPHCYLILYALLNFKTGGTSNNNLALKA